MKNLLIKYSLPFSIIIFSALFILAFPFYKFIYDPDSIGYSAIAEKIAAGNFTDSINGLWSPLSAWLVVPLIKLGIDPIQGFKYINGITGILLLIAVWSFSKKIEITDWLRSVIIYTCIPVFLAFGYYELCADFLLLLFFTLYLIQVCSADFFNNKNRQLLCAIIAVFAYLSKAFFFPFFIIHFLLINFYHFTKNRTAANIFTKFIKNIATGIGSFLVFCIPWIFLLSKKYHFVTYSTAGSYNTYLHLHTADDYPDLLLAPPYPDSYSNWEDPFFPFMKDISIFSSSTTIFKEIKLIAHNILYSVSNFTEISFLSIAIIATVLILLFAKKTRELIPDNIVICLLASLLVPLGYMLFHIETRFIWMLSIVCLIMGGYLLSVYFTKTILSRLQKMLVVSIFAVSFAIGPIQSLKNGVYQDKEAWAIAAAYNANHIHGKVIGNLVDINQYSLLLMSNVIAKNQFYGYSRPDFTTAEVVRSIQKWGIEYYVFSYKYDFEKENFLTGEIARMASGKIYDVYPGIVVFKLK